MFSLVDVDDPVVKVVVLTWVWQVILMALMVGGGDGLLNKQLVVVWKHGLGG